MNNPVNRSVLRGSRGKIALTKEPSILMAARVPVPVAEAIEEYRQAADLTKADAIILALTAYFGAKK